ncbi:MAG TPA: HigA family addiction module antitoxin [Gammaproteobacteria bacterium]|jgi:addiction module HigA family antidote
MSKKLPPVHPGEILREEFLKPLKLSAYKVAKDLNIPANRITGIINEQRAITAETAVLLSHYFGTSAEMWMNLQARYDLRIAQRAAATDLRKLPRHDTAAA